MENNLYDKVRNQKFFTILYKVVIPIINVFFIIMYPVFYNKYFVIADLKNLFIRIFVAISFCLASIKLTNIDDFYSAFYKNAPVLENQEQDKLRMCINLLSGLAAGFISFVITKWVFIKFTNISDLTIFLIPVFNGLVFSFPLVIRFKKQ